GAAEPASPLRPLEEDDGGPPARDVRGRTPRDGDRSPLPLLRPGAAAGPLALLPADPTGSPADLRRRERLLVMVLRGQHLPGGAARRGPSALDPLVPRPWASSVGSALSLTDALPEAYARREGEHGDVSEQDFDDRPRLAESGPHPR